jgi:ribosome-associated protein YbcJ (S4-like RNA binding protein)
VPTTEEKIEKRKKSKIQHGEQIVFSWKRIISSANERDKISICTAG